VIAATYAGRKRYSAGMHAAPSYPLAPLTVSIPRIATDRLLLREFRMADFDAYAENLADPEATKFLSGVSDRRTAWRLFSSGAGSWVLNGKGWWALELRETGEVVGTVGAFVRETAPDVELGWTLYRRFWRRGYASEAAKAALQYSLDVYGASRVIAHITPANTASIGVSLKLGMTDEGEVDFYGERISRYALHR
jgi:RimJ/RimL family protein N-acetyltransferase